LLGLFDYSWWVFVMQRNFRNKKPDFQLPYVYKAKVITIEQNECLGSVTRRAAGHMLI
jgi:hypothetical protein